jgi:hypothetical protein
VSEDARRPPTRSAGVSTVCQWARCGTRIPIAVPHKPTRRRGARTVSHIDSAHALTLVLTQRALIGQAQGVLMERDHQSASDALEALAACAQMLDVQLVTLASALVRTTPTSTDD